MRFTYGQCVFLIEKKSTDCLLIYVNTGQFVSQPINQSIIVQTFLSNKQKEHKITEFQWYTINCYSIKNKNKWSTVFRQKCVNRNS